jgi:hypothetical protein
MVISRQPLDSIIPTGKVHVNWFLLNIDMITCLKFKSVPVVSLIFTHVFVPELCHAKPSKKWPTNTCVKMRLTTGTDIILGLLGFLMLYVICA